LITYPGTNTPPHADLHTQNGPICVQSITRPNKRGERAESAIWPHQYLVEHLAGTSGEIADGE
jgi:hypothetical protein